MDPGRRVTPNRVPRLARSGLENEPQSPLRFLPLRVPFRLTAALGLTMRDCQPTWPNLNIVIFVNISQQVANSALGNFSKLTNLDTTHRPDGRNIMPTPAEAALIRELARKAAELKKITDIRNATAANASLIEEAYAAEVAAEAELAATASKFGVPLAEATTEYGLAASTALVPAGAASGGLVLRVVTAVGGGSAAAGTCVVTVGVGIMAWILSHLAGNLAADKPIQPGVAMTSPRPAKPADEPKTAEANNKPQNPQAKNEVWTRKGPLLFQRGKRRSVA
jgi:hypothetical protein